ncbi:hypothetical protein UWK_01437 [Desulfocapsa sulfexigens DSM 10523]|uniref:Uncharacterized protein n=1 Tax=Desulfocapsa sulfexigens (strain DSM 10523 / SB164P1) TaxID=1167006 RepID=M1P8N3_DESSD|nr:hypothetical protein [Desulfocapsa sulfexigens]AGF77997.1 hypothetical protein UWK_01437 [Desulfocapsa sulfexigens DSM 10523]
MQLHSKECSGNSIYLAIILAIFLYGLAVLVPITALADCPGGVAPSGSTVYSEGPSTTVCKTDGAYSSQTIRWLTPDGYTCDTTVETRDPNSDSQCGIGPVLPDLDFREIITQKEWVKIKQQYAHEAAIGGANSRMKIITDEQFLMKWGPDAEGTRKSVEDALNSGNLDDGPVYRDPILEENDGRAPKEYRYTPSDLPVWDFGVSLQGGVETSEIAQISAPDRESDVSSLALNLHGAKDDFLFNGQFHYRALRGTGIDDGQDSDEYGLLMMGGYQWLHQSENGVNLMFHGFLDLSGNDYGDAGDQTRYVPGAGISVDGWTPVGKLKMAYLFSHDRNADNDLEITDEKYLNVNNMSLAYTLPLTRALFLNSSLSYLYIMDIPDGMDDSSTSFDVGLAYNWQRFNMGITYVKSLDGYGREGVNFFAGYSW